MPKRARKPGRVIRSVLCSEGHVQVAVIDADEGTTYMLTLGWDELEKMAREGGSRNPIGEYVRGVSKAARDMMES